MRRVAAKLVLRREALRVIDAGELGKARGGLAATSEAQDGYPCPGEYSWVCKP